MLTYNVERLAAAFSPIRQAPGSDRDMRTVSSGDLIYLSSDCLYLSPDAKLRQLIDAPKKGDQSADVLACAGLMARMGLDEMAMLGVLLNPNNAISQHCLAQSNPERAARRAIAKTREDG